MAIAQVLRFPGGTLAQYDAIRREIGWTSGDAGKPDGLPRTRRVPRMTASL